MLKRLLFTTILLASIVVAIDPVSPGVFSRMLVVDPPYIAP